MLLLHKNKRNNKPHPMKGYRKLAQPITKMLWRITPIINTKCEKNKAEMRFSMSF
jgi:hypothetical protein